MSEWYTSESRVVNEDLVFRYVLFLTPTYSETLPVIKSLLKSGKKFAFENLFSNVELKKEVTADIVSQINKKFNLNSKSEIEENLVIEDKHYPTSGIKKVYLKVRVLKWEELEPKEETVYEKPIVSELTIKLIDKMKRVCEVYDQTITRSNHHYKNFTFSGLYGELVSFKNAINGSKNFDLYLKEDYSFDSLSVDGKVKPVTFSPTTTWIVYNTQILSSRLSSRTEDQFCTDTPYPDFVKEFVRPVPELIVGAPNYGPTNKVVEMLLGDQQFLNGEYKPSREKISENFKTEVFVQMRNQKEFVNDPVLGSILEYPVELTTLDDVYTVILNRFDIVSMGKLILLCLAKLVPVQELKRIVCRYLIKKFGADEYTLVADFLEFVGDEASKEIGKQLKKKLMDSKTQGPITGETTEIELGDGGTPLSPSELMLQEMSTSLDREDKICLAIFAIIPAAIILLKEIIENREKILEDIKEDLQIIKKAIEQRFQIFFDSTLGVFDILAGIRDGIIEAVKSLMAATILYYINKLIQTFLEVCDSREQDEANTPVAPFGATNINDLLKKSGSRPPAIPDSGGISDELLEDFLNDLSNNLTVTEICLLLSGIYKNDLFDIVRVVLANPKYKKINDLSDDVLKAFFKALSKLIDSDLCERALADYNSRKKMLIELCADPDKLREELLKDLLGDNVDLSDILAQALRDKEENKKRLENVVDVFKGEDLGFDLFGCEDGALVPFEHASQKHLARMVIKNSIRPIVSKFEFEAEDFKRIFEDKRDIKDSLSDFNKFITNQTDSKPPKQITDKKYVAKSLRAKLQSGKDIVFSQSATNKEVSLGTKSITYINHPNDIEIKTDSNFTYKQEKTVKSAVEDFTEIVKARSKENTYQDLSGIDELGFYGKTQDIMLRRILDISSNNGLFLREYYNKFTFKSGMKDKIGNCYDQILSIADFHEQYRSIIEDKQYQPIRCKLQRETAKHAILKISCDLFLASVAFRELSKAFFVLSLFNVNELLSETSFIFIEILKGIEETLSGSASKEALEILINCYRNFDLSGDDLTNEQVLSKALNKVLSELIIPKLVVRYIKAGIDVQEADSAVNDVVFGQQNFNILDPSLAPENIEDKNKFLTVLCPTVEPRNIKSYNPTYQFATVDDMEGGIFLENFYFMNHNPSFYNSLGDEQKSVFDLFKLYCIVNEDIMRFNNLFFPGVQLYNNEDVSTSLNIREQAKLENYNTLTDYEKLYNVRGVISADNFNNNYKTPFSSVIDLEQFCKNVRDSNQLFPGNTFNEFNKDPFGYVKKNFLDRPVWSLFYEVSKGTRLVINVKEEGSFLKLYYPYKQLLSKTGYFNGSAYGKYIKLSLLETKSDSFVDLEQVSIYDFFYNLQSEHHVSKTAKPLFVRTLKNDPNFKQLFEILRPQDLITFAAIHHIKSTEETYPEVKTAFSSLIKSSRQNVLIQHSVLNNQYDYTTSTFDSDRSTPLEEVMNIFQIVFKTVMKAAANTTDPTWKTTFPGPLTPFGWIAKMLDESAVGDEQGADEFMDGTINIGKSVCEDT